MTIQQETNISMGGSETTYTTKLSFIAPLNINMKKHKRKNKQIKSK